MPAGRPTEYSTEIIKKAIEYFNHCEDKSDLPQIAGLAIYLEVHRDTLYDWAEKYPEFSDILKTVMTAQEYNLVKNGLEGKFNSTITKLMLTKHGYREGHDITSGGKEIPIYGGQSLSKHNGDEEDLPSPKED